MYKFSKTFISLWLTAGLGLTACAGVKDQAAELTPEDNLTPIAQLAQADVQLAPATAEIIVPDYMPAVVSAQARQAVENAYDAVEKKRWQDLARQIPLAQDDVVLGMYPRYWQLRQKLNNRSIPVPTTEIEQFLADYPDAFLAEAVRNLWIVASVRQSDYQTALRIKEPDNTWSNVKCALLQARHMQVKRANSKQVLDVFQPGSDCWDMLDQVVSDHVLSRAELNNLLRGLLEQNQLTHANRMAAVMFDNQSMVRYVALIKDPRKWLEQQAKPKNEIDYELISIALARLARSKDRDAAAKYIQNNWEPLLAKADMHWVWGQFGLVTILNTEPGAAKWYRMSGYEPMTDYNHAWEVRAELRELPLDWSRVAVAIRKMTAKQADEPVWRYWYAKALAALGNDEAALQYYQSIAGDLSFYGQLAAEELGTPQPLPTVPPAIDATAIIAAQNNKTLQRAVELFKLGWRREAVQEWNYGIRGMDDMQLRGAAEFARSQSIYDRVVNTSLMSTGQIDMEQRFIAPFEDRVIAKANQIPIDPAWVYGLIRQESRFITDAKSRVGASGLMQLMPATAKWVAKKIGMTGFTMSQVNDFDTNTVLGTSYMNMVLQDLDGSQLLATAGYNAGPGRAKRWRSTLPGEVEGAIFAETIPFTETRLYVKHVLSNAVYYETMFTGKAHSLKDRLGTVSPSRVTRTALP